MPSSSLPPLYSARSRFTAQRIGDGVVEGHGASASPCLRRRWFAQREPGRIEVFLAAARSRISRAWCCRCARIPLRPRRRAAARAPAVPGRKATSRRPAPRIQSRGDRRSPAPAPGWCDTAGGSRRSCPRSARSRRCMPGGVLSADVAMLTGERKDLRGDRRAWSIRSSATRTWPSATLARLTRCGSPVSCCSRRLSSKLAQRLLVFPGEEEVQPRPSSAWRLLPPRRPRATSAGPPPSAASTPRCRRAGRADRRLPRGRAPAFSAPAPAPTTRAPRIR